MSHATWHCWCVGFNYRSNNFFTNSRRVVLSNWEIVKTPFHSQHIEQLQRSHHFCKSCPLFRTLVLQILNFSTHLHFCKTYQSLRNGIINSRNPLIQTMTVTVYDRISKWPFTCSLATISFDLFLRTTLLLFKDKKSS